MKFVLQMFIEKHLHRSRLLLGHCQGFGKSVAIAQSTEWAWPLLLATVLPSSPVLAVALLHLCMLRFVEVVLSKCSTLNQFAVLAQEVAWDLESSGLISQ